MISANERSIQLTEGGEDFSSIVMNGSGITVKFSLTDRIGTVDSRISSSVAEMGTRLSRIHKCLIDDAIRAIVAHSEHMFADLVCQHGLAIELVGIKIHDVDSNPFAFDRLAKRIVERAKMLLAPESKAQ